MSFDGMMLAAVRWELEATLAGGRIDRIYQPAPDTIILHVRQKAASYRLLASAHATHARVHLTGIPAENPPAPPVFCMVLRKHLEGGKVLEVVQPGLERLLEIRVESLDEIGRLGKKTLVCEIMGRHSNIILVDPGTGLILDGIKRYTSAVSRHREVLPGRPYIPPPDQTKLDPTQAGEDVFRKRLLASPLHSLVYRGIMEQFAGFGPLSAREVVSRAGLREEVRVEECGEYEMVRLWQGFHSMAQAILQGEYAPTLAVGNSGYIACSPFDLTQFAEGQSEPYPSISKALDLFYGQKLGLERLAQEVQRLDAVVSREYRRCQKKKTLQQGEVNEAAGANRYRLAGELIVGSMYRLEKGMSSAELGNFYDPEGKPVTVELDPQLTPNENAQAYFKKYNKAKNAAIQAALHLSRTMEEEAYLESVLYNLTQAATLADLAEIRRELETLDYLKPARRKPGQKAKPGNKATRQFMEFLSTEGYSVIVGRNNLENDYLSLRLARPNDLWMHVKGMPGSHVIVRTDHPGAIPPDTMEQAAKLAAYFSKARQSANVPVDYTRVKHVKKPAGARPGKVIYDQFRTLFVTPDASLVQTLQKPRPPIDRIR